MDTKPINQSKDGKSSKKNVAAGAATIVTGAGLGVAGTAIASAMTGEDNPAPDITPADIDIDPELQDIIDPEDDMETGGATSGTGGSHGPHHAASPDIDDNPDLNPEPVTDDVVTAAPEEPVTIEGDLQDADPASDTVDTTSTPDEVQSEEEAPDEIAEAIIAEEEIDPDDLDMANVVTFDDIQELNTPDGQTYTAAQLHDNAGNSLQMIDVDGDNTFDVLADGEGNLLVDDNGNYIAAGNLTVDDAEENISSGDVDYLAHNDDEHIDDFGADTIADDILTT